MHLRQHFQNRPLSFLGDLVGLVDLGLVVEVLLDEVGLVGVLELVDVDPAVVGLQVAFDPVVERRVSSVAGVPLVVDLAVEHLASSVVVELLVSFVAEVHLA